MPGEGRSGTVGKAITLLGLFDETRLSISVGEAARATGMPRATAYRLMEQMVAAGLLTKRGVEGGRGTRYGPGLRLLELGRLAARSLDPNGIIREAMERLRDRCGESVQFVVASGDSAIYAHVVPPRAPIHLYVGWGRRAPLYAGASTRLLLAWQPEEVIRRVLAGPLVAYTPHTPTEPGRLRALLAEIRRTGYAVSFGELVEHTAEMAAPVVDGQGVVGSLSLAGFEERYRDPATAAGLKAELLAAAEEVSRRLGYRGPWPYVEPAPGGNPAGRRASPPAGEEGGSHASGAAFGSP
ncbi:transcriptional regulator, IclR family [Thermaerobacter marianensis DSM 12885]|uniref:Transcriptional regulator, IclR family n=1 Tax=Thermaerobacter marianensis (strain ATCC 700841 / DSM 12885 / JCM 10246 / 7p75a) TaxID=644966 RepID=E6SM95_THEM7|nr:transcriptional regulator, IclR family [Thermaerobacter marianensis DSM 12885]